MCFHTVHKHIRESFKVQVNFKPMTEIWENLGVLNLGTLSTVYGLFSNQPLKKTRTKDKSKCKYRCKNFCSKIQNVHANLNLMQFEHPSKPDLLNNPVCLLAINSEVAILFPMK